MKGPARAAALQGSVPHKIWLCGSERYVLRPRNPAYTCTGEAEAVWSLGLELPPLVRKAV